jgi:outer membrane protein assembly factor BamB
VFSSPAVAGGVVFVGSADKAVYALDVVSGAYLWGYTTGNDVWSSPAVAGGVVFVGSIDGNVYALNASTGAYIWNYTTGWSYSTGWNYTSGGPVYSSPAIAGGVVFVSSDDGNVYALNASTATLIWRYSTTGSLVDSSPAVAGGVVFVGSDDKVVYALDVSSGAYLWGYTTGNDVWSSPAVAGGIVYAGSLDGKVYAFGVFTAEGGLPRSATYTIIAFAGIAAVVVVAVVYSSIHRRKAPKPRVRGGMQLLDRCKLALVSEI